MKHTLPRIGLPHLGIPLGTCGLAGAWTAAEVALQAPGWVAGLLWSVGGVLWILIGGLYLWQRSTTAGGLRADLDHPVIGPLTSFLPVIGLLLLTHFGTYLGGAAVWCDWILVLALLIVAAQLLRRWLTGTVNIDQLHPGYFLPVVAGAFIASISLSSVHASPGAAAAFGAGLFFWLVIGTVVTGRLITRGPLPEGVRPGLAILLAPPAVGGTAWLLLNGQVADQVGFGFVGIVVILAALQLLLIPEYRKIPFSMSFWTFTFPLGAATNFSIRWLGLSPFPGSVFVGWALLAIVTSFVLFVAAGSIVMTIRSRRGRELGRRLGATDHAEPIESGT
ncbi:SLAC1 family transporter [Subtercola endophyticus]|uniref:SLAC1 family transporter n=1 Tax=Subtercola endophyticus TaxID=2895559 RepID=UPI001E47A7D6|nr:TDT family transporter [Subtercola endophyticus]UFS60593.1 TDT family transporter [Subtercola endophyticus]